VVTSFSADGDDDGILDGDGGANVGEHIFAEGVSEEGQETYGVEDEEKLPARCHPIGLVNRRCSYKAREAKVHR